MTWIRKCYYRAMGQTAEGNIDVVIDYVLGDKELRFMTGKDKECIDIEVIKRVENAVFFITGT